MRLPALALCVLPLMSSAHTSTLPAAPDPFIQKFAETRRFQSGRPAGVGITPDGKSVLFLRAGPTSPVQALYSFDVESGKVAELLTAEAVLQGAAQALSAEEKARLERMRSSARGIIGYTLSDDGKLLATSVSGRLYVVERATGKVRELKTGPGAPLDPRFSPDGKLIAYVRDNDLYVLELASNRERRLTHGGGGEIAHGLPEFVAQEEMRRYAGFWWAPDSKRLVYQRTDTSKVEKFAIVDPTHPEKGAHIFPYPRPGKQNADVTLWMIGVGGGKSTPLAWDREKYPYVATVRWPKAGPLTVLVQNRHQTAQALLEVNPASGTTRPLLTETDEAWLNLDQSFPHFTEKGDFLWYTERNGGPEVELRSAGGELEGTYVPPDAGYASFVGFDEAGGWVYFVGSPDPTEVVLRRTKLGGVPERVKTDEMGPAIQGASLSKDGKLLAVTTTTLRYMPRTAVWRTDGTRVGDLPSVAEEPPLSPTTEIRKVNIGDGFFAAVIRPRNFQKGKKYPVVLQVYGGPHHLEVKHSMREELLLQWLADQGFVVVKSDNRGTTNRRGRAWERVIRHDLAGVTMDDQVAVLRALGKELPELDLGRVGIQGWSYGGYMAALGLMRFPELFRVGVAGAPVVDWRDYDTHYTERYMGLPQEQQEAYDKASLLTWAPKLDGSLLLIHGTADDNVYFTHTLKLSDALFRAAKPHDLLPLSDFTHMVADPLVAQRLTQRMAQQLKDVLLK
jgi:dipeptidyl-peptidase-4